MLELLRDRVREIATAIAPLVGVVCVLQVVLVDASAARFVQFLMGAALAFVGMLLLLTGVDLGILPMGRFIGAELPKKGSLWLILAVAMALGVATTVAEPDVLVLSDQVEAVSQGAMSARALVYIIALGVGLSTALGLLRIMFGISMVCLLTGAYALAILLSFLAPADFVSLAYDGGSVTTGVLTAPVLLALALGVSSVMAERSAVKDGFGLSGLASAGPIIVVLLLGLLQP